MPRPRWISRFRVMVLSLVGGVQIPGVLALAHFAGSWSLAVGGATMVSLPYLAGLKRPFDDLPKNRWQLARLWPFFAWWAACLSFVVLAPLATVTAWLVGKPLDHGLAAAGVLSLGAGIYATLRRLRVHRIDVPIAGLPEALDGLRIAQLSDVHCGSYTPPERVAAWVERINRLSPDLIAVTGDLITNGHLYVAPVTRALGRLRAPLGVFACMGNHDYFTDGERLVDGLTAGGLLVLRNRGVVVERNGAQLFVAGVDDTWTGRADVDRALAERPQDTPCLLLAHDPELFPLAAKQNVELTLSGHTHGGQFALPGIGRHFNLARLITRFTVGFYRLGPAVLYVNRGAGTTGPPLRLGAPAEIALLTLRARPPRPAV